ncbi:MAG TPA: hypothetical protein VH540_24520 [Ktedonobacterales bacterium]|jgi:hypothetical protein
MPSKNTALEDAIPRFTYRGKQHRRWPMRLVAGALSVLGMFGLWQFIAHEPAVSRHAPPSLEHAEQQLQLGGAVDSGRGSQRNFNPFPNTSSGTS